MGTNIRYHLLVALIIMLHLLMMQLGKLGFIAFGKKYDVFDTFKKWKAFVENETGKRLNCLRLDNRGEYYNKEFDNYIHTMGLVERR
jgi:hypothetical protein